MERAVLVELLAEGLSIDAIAIRIDRSPSTVSYWLKRLDLRANGVAKFGPQAPLPREPLQALVEEGKSVPQIALAVGRSRDVVRRALRRHGLKTRGAANREASRAAMAAGTKRVELICTRHGRTMHILEGRGSYRCGRCRMDQVAEHRRKMKRTLIAEAGGACVICGYDRCDAALQFHHLDPSQKEFHLSQGGVTRSWAAVRAEAAKCVLLCATHHAEVEAGFTVITKTPRGGLEPPNLD